MTQIIKPIFLEDESMMHEVASAAIADLGKMHPQHRSVNIIRAIIWLHNASHCHKQGCVMRSPNAVEYYKHPAVFAFAAVPGVPGVEFDDVLREVSHSD